MILHIPYLLPEVWRDDVSQTEYDDYRAAHGLRWQELRFATTQELTDVRRYRAAAIE